MCTPSPAMLSAMDDEHAVPTDEDIARRRKRREVAIALQELEGNPITAEEIDMFDMFDRERWSHARCRAYILAGLGPPTNASPKTDS